MSTNCRASSCLLSRRLALAAPFLMTMASPASGAVYEGYGNISVGGSGGSVYHVTSLANSGAGTLRDGVVNRSGPRTIVFDVAGTITLTSGLEISQPYLTIDGETAPSPGITISMSSMSVGMVISGTHDVILRHLRLQGPWVPPDDTDYGPHLTIDGDSGPDHVAQRIVLDHLTLHGGSGGAPDIWGEVRDMTVSWCLISGNNHPTSLSHYPSPYQVRQRISLHHNVWAKNLERNPQIRADVRALDHVNNITYSWGFGGGYGYGMRIRADAGEPKVNANIVNNAFFAGSLNPDSALVYGDSPGADSSDGGPTGTPRPQGTVVTGTRLGSLWVAGNILPTANEDQYSTVSGPLSIPAAAQVTTWPAAELGTRVLPTVGTKFRNTSEQALVNEIAAKFGATTPQGSLSIGDVSITEGNGTSTATFTVSLSAASTSTVSVGYAAANGTALAGSDYGGATGVLLIPAGATSATLTVSVIGDAIYEPDETFLITLSAPVNATLGDAQAVGTIRNDDAQGLSIDEVKVVEPKSGTRDAAFTVTLSPASSTAVTVAYATSNGTATSPGDFTAKSGTLSFPAGTTSQSITVAVAADSLFERKETFTVSLSSPSGGVLIAKGQGTGTVYDRGNLFTVTPCRLVDTRNATGPMGGPALSANSTRTFGLAGRCGIPASASAITGTVTVTSAGAAGNLRVFPPDAAMPLASTINYRPGQTRANSATLRMSASGQLAVRVDQGSGTVHVILDVNGYME